MDLLAEMSEARYEIFERQDVKEGAFDISFIFNDGQILRSHKFLLISLSEPSKKMLDESWAKNGTVEIKHNTHNEFKDLLKFCYLGYEAINAENLISLLEISHCFNVSILSKACIEFISKHEYITEQNVAAFHTIAETFSFPELHIEVKKACEKLYSFFMKTNVLLEASPSFVLFLLNVEKSKMAETEIFEGVVEWGKRSCLRKNVLVTENSLKNEVKDFLPSIRFPTMDFYFLIKELLPNYGYLFEYSEIGKILEDALVFSNMRSVENPQSSFSCLQRMSLEVVICGKNGKICAAPLLYFDEVLNQKFVEIKDVKPVRYKKSNGSPKELLSRNVRFIDYSVSSVGSCWRINYKKKSHFDTYVGLTGSYYLFLDEDGDLCFKKGREKQDFLLAQFDVKTFKGNEDDICGIELI